MSPIKELKLKYEAVNEQNSFSQGDAIRGRVTFTLTEETKVKSIHVKVSGKAHVRWSQGSGERRRTFHAHRKYLKVKEYLVPEHGEDTKLAAGNHCFDFSLNIPQTDMPSSFHGIFGGIHCVLEAKVCRSWNLSSRKQKELNFASKSFSYPDQVQCPVSGSVDKELGVFSKGQVQMSATVNRKVCSPGDTLSIVTKISNSSSKHMTTKFSLQQRVRYHAHGRTKTTDQSLCKVVGDPVKSNSAETVIGQLKIPPDISTTINNCDIISVEYYLKVYLDISFAIDPEVTLPLVIVPYALSNLIPGEDTGPYPAETFGVPSCSDFPHPAFPIGPHPAPAGPGGYEFAAPPSYMSLYPASQ
ncbi:uncharacterized protein V6R79_005820 [Siganus canaliculatus]